MNTVNTVPETAAPVVIGNSPARKLAANKSLVKYIFLSIITLGIYGVVTLATVSNNINLIASRYDGKATMHYFLMATVFSIITLGIYPLIWWHTLCNRIGDELQRRGIEYSFGASKFWLWNILGSLIIVGPYIFIYKLLKSNNLLAADYNLKG